MSKAVPRRGFACLRAQSSEVSRRSRLLPAAWQAVCWSWGPSEPWLEPAEFHAILLIPSAAQHWTERKSALLHSSYCTAAEVPSSVTLGCLSWAQTPEKNRSFLQISLPSSVNKFKTPENNSFTPQNFLLPLALDQATEVASQMKLEAVLQCRSLVVEINVFLGKSISLKFWLPYLFFHQQNGCCKLHKIVP